MNQPKSTPTVSRGWLCRSCDMPFVSKYSLFEHNKSSKHYVCTDVRCKGRAFFSAIGLREHLRQAAVHREYDRAQCQRCNRQFTSTHGVFLHLDMGGCGAITWKWVLEQVRRLDRRKVFVDPDVDFEASPAPYSDTGTCCTTCGRSFKNTVALNQHLASPAHQPKLLKCPVAGCDSHFAILSGLAQHIETGTKCHANRDRKALRKWKNFIAKMDLVTKVSTRSSISPD
ncbi:uncharacterized protein BT62DRAFT_926273 [Guyanagaster necrorhizus]|uniref:C2H2-type domain-containing protein n=1 Tax=Guyanagaster necrorhizus TaxID=856835 RepID=A0A9P7W3Q0_9AGAR|nr:uncharacterized protein BT62DRAFT_926273 [Guyanagaster necrorhizus MCA 3950]KAG7452068.1 hypothetical protein BT62DRAFT_926273 [Guyanagaster necrorhizus MCA 3950]